MVKEVAVESEPDYIVNHNIREVAGIEQFILEAITEDYHEQYRSSSLRIPS